MTKRRKPGRPRGTGDDIVGAILDAALQTLLAVGFTGLAIADVAQVAGLTKAAVYRRYRSKEDLVLAAIERHLARTPAAAAAAPHKGARRRPEAALAGRASQVATPRAKRLARALLAMEDARAVAALRAVHDRSAAALASALADHLPQAHAANLAAELLEAFLFYRAYAVQRRPSMGQLATVLHAVRAGAEAAGARRQRRQQQP